MKKLIAFLIVAFYVVPLFAGMSAGVFTLPTGTNGQVLTYDSTQPNNVKFANAAASSGGQDLQGFTRQMLLEDYTATQEQTFAALPSDVSEGSWNSAVANITEVDSMSVASNILTVDTTSVSTASSAYYLAPDVDFNGGFTYEITAIITTSATADNRCLLGYFRDGTQGESVSLNANTTSVIVTGSKAITVTLDTTTSHTYRISVLATTWKLFVDDVFMAQGTVKSDAGADDIRFGDISTVADANSVFTISALSYVLGTSACNYDKVRVIANTIYVGSTKLTGVDSTIDLTNDLDTGSAATATKYNFKIKTDGSIVFSASDTLSAGERFLGGVYTDASTATYFKRTRWEGKRVYFMTQDVYLRGVTGLAVNTVTPITPRNFVPITAIEVEISLLPFGASSSSADVNFSNINLLNSETYKYVTITGGGGTYPGVPQVFIPAFPSFFWLSSAPSGTGNYFAIVINGYTENI